MNAASGMKRTKRRGLLRCFPTSFVALGALIGLLPVPGRSRQNTDRRGFKPLSVPHNELPFDLVVVIVTAKLSKSPLPFDLLTAINPPALIG
jgi:hypothetical protein